MPFAAAERIAAISLSRVRIHMAAQVIRAGRRGNAGGARRAPRARARRRGVRVGPGAQIGGGVYLQLMSFKHTAHSRARSTVAVAAALAALALAGCATNLECDGHACVGDWKRDMALGGSVVQCADGAWSHAGGLGEACSGYGGRRIKHR
jgi:hypothetical protein